MGEIILDFDAILSYPSVMTVFDSVNPKTENEFALTTGIKDVPVMASNRRSLTKRSVLLTKKSYNQKKRFCYMFQ